MVQNNTSTFITQKQAMVQIIPNVTLMEGAVTAIEKYELQHGFQLITILINRVGEKEGSQFLGNDILNTEIKVLVSETLQKKLQLKIKVHVSGEIKKVNPLLWRANEATWKLSASSKSSS